MSDNDEKKEKHEYDTFIEACLLSEKDSSTHIRTKSILKYLNGVPIIREKNDRPDLITRCVKSDKESYVGIEIFAVDQNSRRKGKKYHSEGKKNKAKVDEIYSEGHEQYVEEQTVSKELCAEMSEKAFELVKGHFNSDYSDFIKAFRYHFNHHAQSVPEYRQNIQCVTGSDNIELAFFIEIEASTTNLFLNPGQNGNVEKADSIPFYREMLSIITSSESIKLLDYIVFFIHDPFWKKSKVVAVRTGNIKKNLKNQGIMIYDYIGERLSKIGNFSVSDEQITWKFEIVPDDEARKMLFSLYKKALSYKRNSKPFAATRAVQLLLYALPGTKSQDEAERKIREFSSMYPSNKENPDDQT